MSRKSISRIGLSLIAGVIVLLTSQTLMGQSLTEAPNSNAYPAPLIPTQHVYPALAATVPTYILQADQPFKELIDDVTVEKASLLIPVCDLNAPCDGQCKEECSCFAPDSEVTSTEVEEACEEVDDDWAVLMTCPCKTHDCDGLAGVSPTEAPPTNQAENFCQQVARLLTPTLESEKLTSEQKQQSVENAMKMVADKALETAEARIAELNLQHEKELAKLTNQLAAVNAKVESNKLTQTWLRNIYAKQFALDANLRSMNSAAQSLNTRFSKWEATAPSSTRNSASQVAPVGYAYQPRKDYVTKPPTPIAQTYAYPSPPDFTLPPAYALPQAPLQPTQQPKLEAQADHHNSEMVQFTKDLEAFFRFQRQQSRFEMLEPVEPAVDSNPQSQPNRMSKRLAPLYVPSSKLDPIPAERLPQMRKSHR